MRQRLTYLLTAAVLLCSGCQGSNEYPLDASSLNYPNNKKSRTDKVFIYEREIPDPYRWLENLTNDEVLDWAKAQNELSFRYLSLLKDRGRISEGMKRYLASETVVKASRDGRWYLIERTEGESGRQFIYLYADGAVKPSVIIEPQALENSQNVNFGVSCISPDGKMLAFTVRNITSGQERIYIRNLETGRYVDRPFTCAPNTSLSWGPFGGFYYNKAMISAKGITVPYALYYHKAGTSPASDIVVHADEYTPDMQPSAFRTADNRFLVVTETNGDFTRMFYKPLTEEDGRPMTRLLELIGFSASIVDNYADRFLVLTNFDAPNGRVVIVNPAEPEPANWITFIPEGKEIKDRVYSIAGKFYSKCKFDGDLVVFAYDSLGRKNYEFRMPGFGTLDGPSGRPTYKDVLFTYRSFVQPSTVYKLFPDQNRFEPFLLSPAGPDSANYVVERVFAPARDGTRIPISLYYKKGLKKNGENPLMIYSNGCLGKALRSTFAAHRLPFVDAGGIFAVAHIRGGSEYGDPWHSAATGLQKKVSSQDLLACIDYLVLNKYTREGHIAAGTEEGGMTVLMTAVNERPELFKVVVGKNGIYDLLNFERYNNATIWRKEFGSVTDFEEFENLLKLSPLHNIREDRTYPALYLECDLTYRFVSAVHSCKFAATLQDKIGKKTPVLIRINQEATGNNRLQETYEWTDRWAFIMYHLDMKPNRYSL